MIAAQVDIDVNLQAFSQFLSQQGVPHRISEEGGYQVIHVQSTAQAEWVQQALRLWQSGELVLEEATRVSPMYSRGEASRILGRLLQAMVRAPATSLLTAITLLVGLVSGLGRYLDRVEFLFYPALPVSDFAALLGGIDGLVPLLQTLTPMFLHFGELHIIFNLLWLWYFGRQLEALQPSWWFLLVVLLCSFIGNTAQYLVSESANFGGMSGVVYGLVGYAWILHNFVPRHRLMLNNSMFVVFVVVMVLMEVFASSWIASAAHAGGLVAGLFIGAAYALMMRLRSVASE
jgi:GlpG protein